MDQRIVEQLRRREAELSKELEATRSARETAEAGGDAPDAAVRPGADHAALYGAILQSAIDYAIIAADLEGRIVEWNVGARNILGWPQDDMVGQSIRAIFTPEDREAGKAEDEMRRALEVGYAMDRRWHLRRDGSRFWADGRMMALQGSDGVAHGYLKILRDETGQLKADTQASTHRNVLRLITDHIDTGILQVNREGAVVFSNPAAQRMLGTPAADLHGCLIDTLLPPPADGEEPPLAAVLRTGETVRDLDLALIRQDGTTVDVTCAFAPVVVDGAVQSVVFTAHDASQRRGLEDFMRQELQRQEERGAAADGVADQIEATVEATVSGAVRLLPRAEAAAVVLVEGEEAIYQAVAGVTAVSRKTREPLAGTLVGEALRLGRPLLSTDTASDDRLAHDSETPRAMIALPFARRGALVGALTLMARQPGALTARDMLVGQILAGHIATSLARADEAQAQRKLRLSEERLQMALEASETIGIWDWDVEHDRCYGDARFARLFSIDPRSLRGRDDWRS